MSYRTSAREFTSREEGGGTVFSIFLFVLLAMLLGVMVDATNAWRNRTFLTSVADIAAHGGAVALARGQTDAEVAAEAARLVEANLASGFFGSVIDADSDVTLAHYDPELGMFDTSGPVNAVIVRIGRTEARGNPVGTYFLRFAGFDLWNVSAESAAVFDELLACSATDGLYAKDQITLTSQTDVGSGFCIHSEDHVWLPQQNTFAEDSYVSMPDLDDCKNKCTDEANPGINPIESHQVFPDFGAMILASYDGFAGSSIEKKAFFASEPADFDAGQNVLISADILSSTKPLGGVVTLSHAEFHALEELPAGLVYEVVCATNGSSGTTTLSFDATTARMEKAALITNCALKFGDGASIIGSVVITTRDSANATVTAGSSVTVGDPTGTCDMSNRSTIMSLSKVSVPAEFVMSNVTIISGDDIDIASATSGGSVSTGVALYAAGRIHIAAQHTFRTCPGAGAVLEPDLNTLRLVLPPQAGAQLAGLN